jgi:hypothetical protein
MLAAVSCRGWGRWCGEWGYTLYKPAVKFLQLPLPRWLFVPKARESGLFISLGPRPYADRFLLAPHHQHKPPYEQQQQQQQPFDARQTGSKFVRSHLGLPHSMRGDASEWQCDILLPSKTTKIDWGDLDLHPWLASLR